MQKVLVIRLHTRVCAMRLTHVIEIMRPLPIEAISGAPPFVRGAAIIRGLPTPVVDLAAILGIQAESAGACFVTIRAGDRQVAIRVDAVLGIGDLDLLAFTQELPPLLQAASSDIVEKIGTLDQQFVMVLRDAWKLPDEMWEAITPQEALS